MNQNKREKKTHNRVKKKRKDFKRYYKLNLIGHLLAFIGLLLTFIGLVIGIVQYNLNNELIHSISCKER